MRCRLGPHGYKQRPLPVAQGRGFCEGFHIHPADVPDGHDCRRQAGTWQEVLTLPLEDARQEGALQPASAPDTTFFCFNSSGV